MIFNLMEQLSAELTPLETWKDVSNLPLSIPEHNISLRIYAPRLDNQAQILFAKAIFVNW
jgi:hypothetical protein